jgi:hypothetical protein
MIRTVREATDQLIMWPDHHARSARSRAAPTAPQAHPRLAGTRSYYAGFADREVQALRPPRMSLRRGTRPRTEALSLGQHLRRAAADGLCAERQRRGGTRFGRQLQQGPRDPERDLRHQHRASAPPRGARLRDPVTTRAAFELGMLGSCRRCHAPILMGSCNECDHRCARSRHGGRHHRQHGRVLSCRRCPAARCEGGRR